jgi:hypothetical protein
MKPLLVHHNLSAQPDARQLIRLTMTILSDGIPVSASLVRLFGQPVSATATNSDVVETYVEMPAGSVQGIPIEVSGRQNYAITNAQAEAVELEIVNPANPFLNLSLGTNTVVSGQKIDLLCLAADTNVAITDYQWTIPGFAISNFVADATSGIVYSNFPTANSNVTYYWVDGGLRQVECLVTVGGHAIDQASPPDGMRKKCFVSRFASRAREIEAKTVQMSRS